MDFLRLKESFVHAVLGRPMLRHFRRLSILDLRGDADVDKTVSASMARHLAEAAMAEPAVLLERLHTHPDGLSEAAADALRAVVGTNEVEHEKPRPWWQHLWHCYVDPFNLLLTVLATISFFTEDIKATVVISIMVTLSTSIRFFQEAKSNKAADKLKAMVRNTATVLRCDVAGAASLHAGVSRSLELPIKQLVPGDIVVLSAGDMIPADLRVLHAKDLFVSQAAMTGESLPVEKFVDQRKCDAINPLDFDNICFMGTNVVSGSATAVVVTTGERTYFGDLAQRITAADRRPTAFQADVNRVSWLLIRFMLVMSPVVFFINGFTKGDWLEAFLFAMAVAVGLTPEMLPMIVTSTLAKGALILSRQKIIIKRLDAVQNFGAMDILCTDKTGTLTQDRIFLERHTDVHGAENAEVLEYAYLNSYYQTGLKNLLDVAVLDYQHVHHALKPAENYRKVDEVPFDFQRRRMTVVVAEHEHEDLRLDHHLLICKGAIEEIVSVCTHFRHGELIEPLTPAAHARIIQVTSDLNDDGLRVVGVAIKEMPPDKEVYGVADECGLTLVGYIAFLDPPKESAAPALKALKEHGVAVKVLTGDNPLVAAKICREVGLPVAGMLLGADVEAMHDAALLEAAEKTTVFAKLSPSHKERVVRVLHEAGHVVGFMGDGINDAPALRAADIGISVDSAVDIAKEAADIILLEKSLMVLEAGVLEGRKTFANMLKYIKMTASSNFGNVFSVLIASAFLPFLPMLPMQLLVQNLLYDISQIGIPFDHVDEESIKSPQRWNPGSLGYFMIHFGPVSSIFDIATFLLLWHVFGANGATPESQTLFQSGWFIEGLLSQTLIVHMIRTRRLPFLQSRASWQLMLMSVAVMLVGLGIVMGPFADHFKLTALPLTYFPWLLAILLAYMLLVQVMKGYFARRYGWQ
ncbi:magnesium transporter [Sterolibacterium denitrificans]|uniref:Magnesium-transporting ATPase, P-type 1 n=1 Tax=Sterolibacterium denitrificans TaxID=157592 RepID=A0A7Z7HQP6_9PROT|nr:magnesium-translocating P-type ATPase [Sterolibacterium denitrificans]SMB25246.1 magnesium transporter [Sterolibacterium denitrificans]